MTQTDKEIIPFNSEQRSTLAKCYSIILHAARRKRITQKQTTDRGEFGDLTQPVDREPDSKKSDR